VRSVVAKEVQSSQLAVATGRCRGLLLGPDVGEKHCKGRALSPQVE